MTAIDKPVVGGTWEGARIMAVHLHGDPLHPDTSEGVVLAWLEHKGEYVVWTVGPDGHFSNGSYTFDERKARYRYAERVAARVFRHFNELAPSLTFLAPNTED